VVRLWRLVKKVFKGWKSTVIVFLRLGDESSGLREREGSVEEETRVRILS